MTEKNAAAWRCAVGRSFPSRPLAGTVPYGVRSTQLITEYGVPGCRLLRRAYLYPDSLVESPPINPATTKSGLLPAYHQTFFHRYAVSPLLELSITNSDNA
ncbi:predicted protein [Histoplasma capsulatum G186AR]|uniref:Uncharacterized protein n=1 Tax=Ajellomyces capsulatus (strain G186AR / H82 / ATCC MYA-2454 / RMSCC 2432) TaxID=447093 RepID=C0NXD8_AJECG|nr:uncharacterized protein HCBG_08130 [Histoplasma capsulatum G186AR]EEH04004.1 predicted protein [Histoplasma capsulatum G186AR]